MKKHSYQSPRILLIYINIEHSVTNTSTEFRIGGDASNPDNPLVEEWIVDTKQLPNTYFE